MAEDALARFLADPATLLLVLTVDGERVGFCEFEGLGGAELELVHFGLVPEVQGQGLGPWLLDTALRAAWRPSTRRIWLHTDDWDHPAARRTYRRAGFSVFDERPEPIRG